MCDFCREHGDGKVWYLNASNYATELLNDLERKDFIRHFYHEVIEKGNRQVSKIEKIFHGWFFLPAPLQEKRTRRSQKSHFGQIIPLEEISKILDIANSITRVTCGCRWAAEKKESRTCYGISTGPPHWYEEMDMEFFGSPDVARLEQITREEALEAMTRDDHHGMVHSLWTFETPFIGAICNCDGRYCLAMRSTLGLKMPVMFRAEFVATVRDDACNGCQACVKRCPFQAIRSTGKKNPCLIDAGKCYGCGVCRAVCTSNAIDLVERDTHPVAKHLWI